MTLAVLLLGLRMAAFDFWYEPRRQAPAGLTVLGSTRDNIISEIVMHVRAGAPDDKTPWGIIWDMTDSLNFTRARLTLPSLSKFDDHFGTWYGLCVERIDSGLPTTLLEVPAGALKGAERGENSLKLVCDNPAGNSARLYVGRKELVPVSDVPFSGGDFALWAGCDKVRISRLCLELDTISLPSVSQGFDSRNLPEADSKNPAAGVWEFLDREINEPAVALGGNYRLAVIPTSTDCYEIVYLSGADADSGLWQPGMVKGTLRPTDFQGDYDLTWRDSRGRLHTSELNAALSPEGNLLTLNFPLWRASLRFRRVRIQHR